MKISGCLVGRNAQLLDFPVESSPRSILPICGEVVLNVCRSVDRTLDLVSAIADPKLRAVAMCLDVLVRMDPGTVAAHALPQCTDDEFDAAVMEAAQALWGPRRNAWPADVRTVLARKGNDR